MNERNLFPETIVVSDKKNAIEYKAMAFISEQTKTTFNYEIKRVRALWDPTLSIPGTGRRGGWRCPVGTRYGGQITDRFGRNCGWGVARRLANAITSIGDRLENRDDERRNRRVERRNARMIARLQQDERGGALERGARNIAERLEGGVAPTQTQRGEGRLQRIFGDDGPLRVGPVRMPRERQDRQPRRQPQQRRPVQREIEQPTTPQNEEQTPAAPERPVRPAPARRRRGQAQTDAVAPEDAPMPNESFDDYTNRKYEEYKSRIEKIQREGGNAGLLTRDEWLKFNEGNLREAYNRVNNVPDAERPAPKPRRRAPRRRRVNASDARAQESANRRPRAEDRPVPEVPQPKPSRRVDETPRPLEIEADPDFGAEPDLGGSLPDVRSVRNVRNRFRERGLPDTAYWRADDYAGDDKAELERRFGRYFDANNQRNARGDFVNNRIQEGDGQPAPRKQPPASPRQPAVTQREQNALPEGWNQGPGTIITHDNGDIIDQQAVTNTWFVIYSPGGVKENFATREEAIAWHKQNVLNRNNVSAPRQPGNSDNAARSEELRRNREAMAQAAIADAAQRRQGEQDEFELKPPPANGNPQDNPFDSWESKKLFERLNDINTWIKKARKYLDGEGPAPRNYEQMPGNATGVSEQRTRERLREIIQERDRIKESLRKRGYADAEQARLDFNRFIKRRRAQPAQPAQSPRPAAPQQPNNRPQPQVDLREPDSGFERLLDEEEEVAARVGGNSDDAANSERLRRAREFAANRPGRVQDFNSIVGSPLFVGYIADAIRGNGNRLAIVNNPANFPNSPAGKRQVVRAAQQNIATFTRWREDLERAVNRGVIGDNDFIEVDGEQVKLPAIKVALINNIDAWGEVLEANQDSSTTAPNAPRRPRRQGAARSRRNARSSQTSGALNIGQILGLGDNRELAYVKKFNANPPNIPAQGVNRRGQIVWNPDVVRAFNQAELEISQSNLRDTHMAIYLENNVYIVRKTDAKNIEDAWRNNNSQRENALGYRDINATSFPEANINAQQPANSSAGAAARATNPVSVNDNKQGTLRIDRTANIMGKYVDNSNPNIQTSDQAIAHVRNGGDLSEVPHQFWQEAVKANSSTTPTDRSKRFRQLRKNGGAIGETQIYVFRGSDGKATKRGWVFKAAKDEDNVGEVIGWNFQAALGMQTDGSVVDGLYSYRDYRGQNKTKNFVILPFAQNAVPENATPVAARGEENDYNYHVNLMNRNHESLPGRLSTFAANFLLGTLDRHRRNGFGQMFDVPGRGRVAVNVAWDLGWAGRSLSNTVGDFQKEYEMDNTLLNKVRATISNQSITQPGYRIGRRIVPQKLVSPITANVEQRRKIQQDTVASMRDIAEKTRQIISLGRDRFVRESLMNMPNAMQLGGRQSLTAVRQTAGKIFDGLQRKVDKIEELADEIERITVS